MPILHPNFVPLQTHREWNPLTGLLKATPHPQIMGDNSATPSFLAMTVSWAFSQPLLPSPLGLILLTGGCSHAGPTDPKQMLSQVLTALASAQPSTHFTGQGSSKAPGLRPVALPRGNIWGDYPRRQQPCFTQARSPLLYKLDSISLLVLKALRWVSIACGRMPELFLKNHPFAG